MNDETIANRMQHQWEVKYGNRFRSFFGDITLLTENQKMGYIDLFYRTFPYLSRKNPYDES